MEGKKQEKHFVLVHGMCQGAWCWYKLIPLLKKAGHKVTALDMEASGINTKAIEDVLSFEEYSKPLLDFMASLSIDEKVILVGHSLGGMNIAFAMEMFPDKISAAVFLTAIMPDTVHQPSFVLNKFVESVPEDGWFDTKFWTYGSKQQPLTAAVFGPQFLQHCLALSPVQ
ncbi:hypothetical protein SOVF_196010, partial [Spinacia oleracea]